MPHFSTTLNTSLPVPVLIANIHASFTVADAELTLNGIREAYDMMATPFYYVNILGDITLDVDDLTALSALFEGDGGILNHPHLRGVVLVNAKGMVQVLKEFVINETSFDAPMVEAPTREAALAVISEWIAQS